MSRWHFECYFHSDKSVSQLPLSEFPVSIGRDDGADCTVAASSVSRLHARLEEFAGELFLSDLNSRNGTWVNHRRISDTTRIVHGDVIHLGSAEIRLIDGFHRQSGAGPVQNETHVMSGVHLSARFPMGIRDLEELLASRSVNIVYQPIIAADGKSLYGYEALGRGRGQISSPLQLFTLAESFDLAVDLSELMRTRAIEIAQQFQIGGELLVNTHPDELNDPDRLLKGLREVRQRFPEQRLTLELHEQVVMKDQSLLPYIRQSLDGLKMKLAFDDFGVGQSRLMDLVASRPDMIKFDRILIDGIDHADESRVNLLNRLRSLASELSIATLAECVSNAGEYRVCKSMGFDFYQGFYFAKPQPPESCQP